MFSHLALTSLLCALEHSNLGKTLEDARTDVREIDTLETHDLIGTGGQGQEVTRSRRSLTKSLMAEVLFLAQHAQLRSLATSSRSLVFNYEEKLS